MTQATELDILKSKLFVCEEDIATHESMVHSLAADDDSEQADYHRNMLYLKHRTAEIIRKRIAAIVARGKK